MGVVIDFRPKKEQQRAEHAQRYVVQAQLALDPDETRDYVRCAFMMQPENKAIVLLYANVTHFSDPALSKELLEKAAKLS